MLEPLADLGEKRFYRINSSANYGPLNSVARYRINTDLITRNWDDLLRVAGSLKLGFVSAHDLMRTFQGSGRNSTLARALGEYGRIGKTLHLLDLADDELYRRSLLIQVNKGERRHGLARTVFHGRGGELRQAYREGQEDQLGALGLVLNAIVLWNTRYMGLALDELRAAGKVIQPEDVERLSPLVHHHSTKFGATFAAVLRRRRVRAGDKWHVDEVALKICGKRHWLWRAVDQHGVVLDILVQERRDQAAAERFLRRVLDGEGGAKPRVVITDKLASYPPAIRQVLPHAEHRRHKRLNNRAENSHLPTRQRQPPAALQIRRARATFLGPAQRRVQPVPPTSTPTDRLRLQTDPHPRAQRLAGRHSSSRLAVRQLQSGRTRAGGHVQSSWCQTSDNTVSRVSTAPSACSSRWTQFS